MVVTHKSHIFFEKIFASAMCIRQIYECNQVHSVRSCCDRLQKTLGTRYTDRAGMQFKVVFLVALITVNTI